MTIEYKEFIEKLRLAMITEGGIPEERIRFCQEEAGPAVDDRLLVETVVMGDKKMVCGIHVGELYSCYQEGVSFTAVKEKVSNNLRMVDLKLLERLEQRIGSYEAVSEHLIIRAVSFPLHQSSMEEAVYRRIGDIALVVYTLIDERKDNISSVKINRNLLKIWGKSEDEVFQYAMENTMRRFPPRLYQLPEVLLVPEYEGIDFMDPDRQGMLIYPKTNEDIHLTIELESGTIYLNTINLDNDWEQIEADLLQFVRNWNGDTLSAPDRL